MEKWIRFKTEGLVPEVVVQVAHIIMIHPLKKGGCRITLDPSIHEVTEFDVSATMDEVWATMVPHVYVGARPKISYPTE